MKSMQRLLLMVCCAALSAGCATTKGSTTQEAQTRGGAHQEQAIAAQRGNPRTMAFPVLTFRIPKSERVQLKNGMIVFLLQDHELPIVNMTAYLNGGGIYDPPAKVGLASLTGAALRSGGTQSTPPGELDRELEFMASSIESSIGSDSANVSLSSLTKNLDRTLALFAELMMKPAFETSRVELARLHALEVIRRQNDDPKGIAGRELNLAIYPDHPLSRIPTIASVKAITRDDMIDFQKRCFYPADMVLAVSGDFDREKLLNSLETLFAGWPNRTASFPTVPPPMDDPVAAVLHVQKQVNQSVIRMGHLGIDKNNPDLYALKVMDFILGGGFTSRLTQEIRSNQGLAYNVSSYFETGHHFRGCFIAETETKSETTVKATTLLRSIIAGMTLAEVSDRELKLAKDAIINSFIFGFTRSDQIVNQQARLEFYGYPQGYLENFRDNIARVTKADVLRVARRYLHPDAMKLVVVGDDKKFDQPLSTFGNVREIPLDHTK